MRVTEKGKNVGISTHSFIEVNCLFTELGPVFTKYANMPKQRLNIVRLD